MRIGRTGIFTTKSGKLGVAAVVAVTSGETLVAKEPNTGTLIRFNKGEFATFDSCSTNPHAAGIVREKAGVSEGSYSYGGSYSRSYGSLPEYNSEPDGVIDLAEFEFTPEAATFDFALAVKQIRNKKRVTAIPASLASLIRPFVRGTASRASVKKTATRKASRKATK